MTSISDVAQLAGVSSATVSRVLSGSSYPVRDDTRSRVVDAATQLGFRPNQLARSLVTSRTNIVAAIVHDISDPYFAEVVRALGDAARDNGYQLLASSSDRDPDRELEWLDTLLSYRVDGLILASSVLEDRSYQAEFRKLLACFHEQGRPVVRLATHLSNIPGVTVDQRKAAASMIDSLLQLGHERIGLITGPRQLRAAVQRAEGYRIALEKAGIDFDRDLVAQGSFSSDGGALAIAEVLQRAPDITAVFATNDAMAIGALRPLMEAGIRVPQDLSLAGFNDLKACRYLSPSLTTVHVPIQRQVDGVFQMLLDGLEGRPLKSRQLATHVVQRESTARARRSPRVSERALARLASASARQSDAQEARREQI